MNQSTSPHDLDRNNYKDKARKAAVRGDYRLAMDTLRKAEQSSLKIGRQDDVPAFQKAMVLLQMELMPALLAKPYVPLSPAMLAARIKNEIMEDIATDRVPLNVTSFAQLHNFVDANCYGGTEAMWDALPVDQAGDVDEEARDEMFDLMNTAMQIVDTWLKVVHVIAFPAVNQPEKPSA